MNQQEITLDIENLSIAQTKEFNLCVSEHRKEFDQMLCKLAEDKNLHSEIFFTSIFSREPEFSPLYERCCKLSFIKKQMENGAFQKIIVDDIELYQVLKKFYDFSKEGVEIHCSKNKLRQFSRTLFPLRNFVRSFCFVVFMFFAKQKRNDNELINKDIILLSTNILKGSIEKNGTNYSDRNFPNIIDFIPREDRDRIVFLPQFPGGPRPFNKTFGHLRKNKQSFIIKADYLQLKDYLDAFSYPFRINIRDIDTVKFLKFDITQLIVREYWQLIYDFKIIESLLNCKIFKRLKESGIEIYSFIDWYENQLSSKGLIYGFRQSYPESKIIGYCGIIDSASYRINLHPSEYENKQKLLPHQIKVLGGDTKDDFMEFTKNINISSAPSLRYKYIHEIDSFDKGSSGFTILVALPIFKDQSKNILSILEASLRQLEEIDNLRIHIKVHPTQSPETYNSFSSIESETCRFIDGNFFDCVKSADLLVSAASTTCMEALAIGVPVAIIGAKNQILQNPIPKSIHHDYWRICYSSNELIGFSKRVFKIDKNDLKIESEKIKDSYFMMPTNQNIKELIALNE